MKHDRLGKQVYFYKDSRKYFTTCIKTNIFSKIKVYHTTIFFFVIVFKWKYLQHKQNCKVTWFYQLSNYTIKWLINEMKA